MKTHKFTLILSGVSDLSPELANALYEATGGDIECNMRDGVAFLEFERAAPKLHDAITSAIREVEGADVGVRVVRVESEAATSSPRSMRTFWGQPVAALSATFCTPDEPANEYPARTANAFALQMPSLQSTMNAIGSVRSYRSLPALRIPLPKVKAWLYI